MGSVKIGTLSFEVQGKDQQFPPALTAEKRMAIIERVVAKKSAPDLLVCAGHTLDNDDQLEELANRLSASESTTAVILEVRDSKQTPRSLREPDDPKLARKHSMFLIPKGSKPVHLGGQYFGTAGEAESSKRVTAFKESMKQRSVYVGDHKVFALCCGELNIVKGSYRGAKPVVRDAEIATELMKSDIIVNPTHDLMSRPGLLDAKRQWLSRSGRNRVAVSVSNWNTKKPTKRTETDPEPKTRAQCRDDPRLHTLFHEGSEPLDEENGPNYRYREWKVEL